MAQKKYYAVAYYGNAGQRQWVGRIFSPWPECEAFIKGKPNVRHKGFVTKTEAQAFLAQEKRSLACVPLAPPLNVDDSPPFDDFTEVLPRSPKPAQRFTSSDAPTPDKLTSEQRSAFERVLSGGNYFITGHAGTGKSFLLQCLIRELEQQGKQLLVCAPTGIAAINIHGITIHRAFHVSIDVLKNDAPIRQDNLTCDAVIIDEISMCRIDLFSYVMRTIQQAGKKQGKNIQIILMGDFFQLPPVVTGNDSPLLKQNYPDNFVKGYAFEAPEWKQCAFTPIVLEQVIRQSNSNFIAALNLARKGDISCIAYLNQNASSQPFFDAISLFGSNVQVNACNQKALEALSGDCFFYSAREIGTVKEGDRIVPPKLAIKPHCRVMSVRNDAEGHYQNGSMGTVLRCAREHVVVKFDNGNVSSISNFTWDIKGLVPDHDSAGNRVWSIQSIGKYTQIPLKLAYAVTIHKSQGQTFDHVNLSPHSWDSGQLYVALSRVRDISGLHLLSPIQESDLSSAPTVLEFDRQLSHEPFSGTTL